VFADCIKQLVSSPPFPPLKPFTNTLTNEGPFGEGSLRVQDLQPLPSAQHTSQAPSGRPSKFCFFFLASSSRSRSSIVYETRFSDISLMDFFQAIKGFSPVLSQRERSSRCVREDECPLSKPLQKVPPHRSSSKSRCSGPFPFLLLYKLESRTMDKDFSPLFPFSPLCCGSLSFLGEVREDPSTRVP